MPNTTTICFCNNKGGSGKSTTCSNIGYFLAESGKKVLLIDGDMQLNLSLSILDEDTVLQIASSQKNLYHAIKNQQDLTDYIFHTPYPNLDIIASSTLMSSIEYDLFSKWQREYVLKKCLQPIKDSGIYDYILIDSPPTLGGWVINILAASDKMIIPVEASPWGLFGLSNIFMFLNEVKGIVPDLQVLGIVITKIDGRKNYYKQTISTLKELPARVFESCIHLDSNIEWAQDNSKPLGKFRRSSRSSKEYYELTQEVIKLCQ